MLIIGLICAVVLGLPGMVFSLVMMFQLSRQPAEELTGSSGYPACCCLLSGLLMLPLILSWLFLNETHHYCRACGLKLD